MDKELKNLELEKSIEDLEELEKNIANRIQFDERFSRISNTPWDKLNEKDKEYYIKNFGR